MYAMNTIYDEIETFCNAYLHYEKRYVDCRHSREKRYNTYVSKRIECLTIHNHFVNTKQVVSTHNFWDRVQY